MNTTLPESLQNWALKDEVARRAFEVLAQRQRKRTELTVEVLMRDAGCMRADAVKFLKQLDDLACGRFIAGRGSKQSRFRWRYAMNSVGQVALGKSQIPEELPWDGGDLEEESAFSAPSEFATPMRSDLLEAPPAALAGAPATRSRLINHTYPLRPDLLAPIGLPADLTAQEADRLALFIKALAVTPPIQGENGGVVGRSA